MATSILSNLSQGLKTISLIVFLSVSGLNLASGQLTLNPIVDNPLTDSYAVTFTDELQKQIIIQLSATVKPTSSLVGWTVKINSVPVVISSVGYGANATQLMLTLASSITFANKNLVTVSYNNALGNVEDYTLPIANKLQSFTDHAAVNNKAIDANLLKAARNIGTDFLDECAPVKVRMTFQYGVKPNYRNSIYFRPDKFQMRIWYDPIENWRVTKDMDETLPVGSGDFTVVGDLYTYEDWVDRCRWEPRGYVQLYYNLPNGSLSSRLDVVSSMQTYVLGNHHTDNIDLAGDFVINPPIGDSNNEYCRGSGFAHLFTDNTYFNCNPIVETIKPNLGVRTVRFLYGTNLNGGNRIPNVWVQIAAGKQVQITDASGNLIPPPFAFDPYGNPGPWFPTNAYGVFEGPLVTIPEGQVSSGMTSFNILHIGNYTDDQVGDKFEVLLQNWSPCNPYPGTPIQMTSYIEIIDAPPAPGVDSPNSYCFNGIPATISATKSNAANLLNWYSDAALTDLKQSSSSTTYVHGKTTPGTYSFWVTETGGNGCEGLASEIVFTIRQELLQPGIITGPTGVCTNATGLVYSVAADPPVMPFGGATKYVWSVPAGWSITAGQGTKQITVNAGVALGPQNISVQSEYNIAPACPSLARTIPTTVYQQPTAPLITKSPNVASVCVEQTLTITAVAGTGGTGTVEDQYRYSTDAGFSWSAWSTTLPSFTAVLGTNLVESRRTATGAGCNTSGSNQVSWNVVAQPGAPTLNTKTPNLASVCRGTDVSATFNAGSGGVGCSDQYEFRTHNGTVWSAWAAYTPASAISTTGKTQVEIQGRRGNCTASTGCTTTAWVLLASWTAVPQPVAPTLLAKTPNLAGVCTGTNVSATFTAGTDGLGCTDSYQYRTHNGTAWSAYAAYIPGNAISTAGKTQVEIQGRRGGCTASTGCTTTAWVTLAAWTVSAQPVAPTLLAKTPNLASVCDGTSVSATFTAGTGGVGCTDEFQYRTHNGTAWSAWAGYTAATGIATTGITQVEIQGRRGNCSATSGCTTTGWSLLSSWSVVPQPGTPTLLAKTPNLASVCQDANVSATFNPGTGGLGCSDEFQFRTHNGTAWSAWAAYSAGTDISTTGKTQVEIQARRGSCTATSGCTTTGWVLLASWTAIPQPASPTLLTKTPNLAAVCDGTDVSATFNPGTGGVGCADEFRFRTHNGAAWSAYAPYTPGNNISTLAKTQVEIQGRRAGCTALSGCNASAWTTLATWNVVPQPTAPTLLAKTPGGAAVCSGVNVSATFIPGTGGTGCSDEFQFRTHNGTVWSAYAAYTPGNNISTTAKTQVEIQGRRGNCTALAGCTTTPWVTLATWTVNPLPAPVISGNNDVCAGAVGVSYTTALVAGHSYAWAISGGVITAGGATNTITVTWGAAGSGWVKVTETIAATGCAVTTANYNVTINPGAPLIAPAKVSGDVSVCLDGNINIDITDVAGAGSYLWDFSWVAGANNATTVASQINIDLTGVAAGPHTVTVAASNGCGTGPSMAPAHAFTIFNSPAAAAGPNQDLCNTLVATLAAVPTFGTGTWTKISGPGSVTFSDDNLATSAATVTLYGDYVFRWSEENGLCTSYDEVSVRYAQKPTVIAPVGQDLCNTKTTTLTATGFNYQVGSTNWKSYQWAWVGGPDNTPTFSAGTSLSTSVTVDYYGVYVFSITETNGTCSDTRQVTVRFAEQPTVTAPAAQNLCGVLNTTVTATGFSYSAVPNVNWKDYSWTYVSGPDNTPTFGSANALSTTIAVDLYGDYVFRITENNGSCTDSKTVAVRFAEQPTVTAPVDKDLCGTLTTALSATGHTYQVGSTNWKSYAWSYVSGPDATPTFSAPTALTTNATVDLYGEYVFRITETNGACTNSKTVTVKYAQQPVVTAPAAQNLCNTKTTTLTATGFTYQAGSTNWKTFQWAYVSGPDATPTFGTSNALSTTVAVDYYGDYVFSITETNGTCSNTKNVNVRFAEQPTVTAPGPQNLCGTLNSTLTATGFSYSAAPNVNWKTYAWTYVSGPDNTPTFGSPAALSTTIAVDLYGDYVFRITETNGSCTNNQTVAVRFAQQPTVTAPIAQSLCNTKTTTLTATGFTYQAGSTNWKTYTWAWVSGPDNTPSFTAATALSTGVTVDYYGDYVFSITETNGSCSDTKQVSVRFAEQPTVTAPAAQNLCGVLNTTVTATGFSYSAAPNVNWKDYSWTYVSGPDNTPTFGSANALSTTIAVDLYGDYVFRITENNGSCTDNKTVAVRFAEQPTVTAPADKDLCGTLTTALSATGHTYQVGSTNWKTYAWSYVSGPDATPTFSAPTALTTNATVDLYGEYVFRITETNGACTNSKTVTVKYAQQPVVTAPAAQNLCNTKTTTLTATGFTYQAGSTNWKTFQWAYVSGPDATPTFGTSTALSTTVAVDYYGDYVFSITETNGTCSNTKNVNVRFAEQPAVTAPGPQNLCGTLNSTLTATGFSYSAAPNINWKTYAWTYVSGPDNTPTFGSPAALSTTIAVDLYGDYVFRITETNGSCTNNQTVAVRFAQQPTVTAPVAQNLCDTKSTTLTATGFTYQAGSTNWKTFQWAWVSGPDNTPTFSAGTSLSTGVTVDYYGDYVFSITETNGSCSNTKQVSVRFAEKPTATAGADTEINALTYTLAAVPFVYSVAPNQNWGSHTWTLQSSSTGGVVTSWGAGATNPDPAITVSKYGDYVFRWTETNGPCSNFDEVTLKFVEGSNAGPDQDLCDVLTTLLAGNTPSTGTGTWTKVSGPGTVTFVDGAGTPGTRINVSQYGSYVLQWTLSVGVPPANQDQVTIIFNENPVANAGADYQVCYTPSIILSGTIGGGASAGTWSMISGGAGTLGGSTTAAPNVTATYTLDPSDAGKDIMFRLTTDDPAGACPAVWDEVIVKVNPLPVTSGISGDDELCNNDVNKIYQVTNHGAAYSYAWTYPAAILDPVFVGGLNFIIVNSKTGSSGMGTIEVTETIIATGCSTTKTFDVTVAPVMPGEVITGPATVCVGSEDIPFAVTTPRATSEYVWTLPPGASITSPDPSAPSITVTFGTAIAAGTIMVNETTVAGCLIPHLPKTVNVTPLPEIFNVTSPIAYCSTDLGVTITLSGSQATHIPSSINIEYQLYNGAVAVDGPKTGTGVALTWPDKPAGSYTVKATNTITGCMQDMSGTATPVENTITAGTIGADQAICENTAPAPFTSVADATGTGSITYQWQVSADGTTFVNIPGATSATFAPASLNADRWYKRIATSTLGAALCTLSSNEIKVTVDNFTAGTITANQTICEGDIPAELISGTAPTADGGALSYQWQSSTDGLTYTNVAAGGNAETYTPAALTVDTWFRRIVTSSLSPALCALSANSVKITVVNFTPGVIISDQTICEGTVPATFTGTAAGGDGTFTYQWQESTDDITFTDIAVAATGLTYTSPALSTEKYFRRKAISVINPSCEEYTNSIHVTINTLEPGTITADQTICEGDIPAGLTGTAPTVSAGATVTYVWQSSADNITYVNIPGATNASYAPPALNQDTWYRRIVTSTLGSVPCALSANTVKITVNNFTPGSIAGDQTICEGDDPVALTSVTPAGDGTFTYLWESSTDNITYTPIATATSETYDPPVLTQDTWYRRIVTSTLSSVPCALSTNAVRITVNNFNPGSIAADQTICEGTAPAPFTSVTPTGDGAFTYKWYSKTASTAYTVIGGATSETYSPGTLNEDMWYYREVTSTLNGKLCIENTVPVQITVNNLTPGSITGDQTICDGADPVAFGSVPATFDGTIAYMWQSSNNGITFTDLGVTTEVYDSPALTQDKWFRRIATSTLSSVPCALSTNIIKVTVINFLPGSIGSNQTICEGTAPMTFTSAPASGDGLFTYQWQKKTSSAAWGDITGATSETFTSGPLTEDTWFRRIVISTLNTVPCTLITNEALVTVVNFIPGSVSTTSTTICAGDTPAAFTSVAPSGDGAFTYQWQSSANGTDYINIPSASSDVYSPGALMVDTWYRRQVVSTLNGAQCTGYTAAVLVAVNNFTPGSIAGDQTICEGDDPVALTSVTPAGDGTFTYLWESSTDNITYTPIATATSETYDPPVLTQDTWYRRIVTSTLSTVPCALRTNAVRITVNNFNPGSIAADQTICEGTAPAPFTSVTPTGDGAFTYKWYSKTASSAYTVIGGATSETYSPGTLNEDMWYYREVTSTLNGKLCIENTVPVQITVNNLTPGSITGDQTICEGATPAPVITDVAATFDAGATLSYQWQQSSNGVVFTDMTGETNESLTLPALTADRWYKRIAISTLSSVPCALSSNSVKITVINFSPGSISGDQTICEATAPTTFGTVTPTGDGTFTYQWQDSPDGITFTDIVGATSESYTSTSLSASAWFRRIVTSTVNTVPCALITNEVKVTVNHVDPGTVGSDETICEGSAPAVFTGTVPTGDGVLTYQWQSSLDGSGYTNITGATGATYTSTPLSADTWFKRQVISTLNGKACGETSPAILVTVVNFTPGTISGAQTVCETEDPVAFTSVTPTGDGTFTYLWESSTDNITYNPIATATGETYDPPVLAQDTWYRRIVTSTLSSVPCALRTNAVRITVNNFNPGSITADQTICESSVPVPLTSVTPTGDGIFTYQWEHSTDGVNFTDIGGAIYETYSPPALTADTWYRRVVTSTLGSVPCALRTNMVKITVNNFMPGSITGDVTICEGATPAMFGSVLPSGDGASYAYQWKSSSDGVNFVNITGATSDTYASVALNADMWFKRVVTSTLNGIPCIKETNVVKVTVNNVNGGTIISDQTICIGSDPVTFWSIVNGTGDGTVTFQWQQSADGVSYADIAGADAQVYDAPVISMSAWYRRVTKSVLNTVECSKISNAVKITVNDVQGGVIGSNQTICYGSSPVPFTSVSDGLGTGTTVTYQWLRSNDDVIYSTIPGATATTYTPAAHYTDTWYKRRIVSILNGVMCSAESNSIRVTVNPLPMALLTGGATICPAESSTLRVEMMAGTGPYTVSIENHGIVSGYVSNSPITVTPAATTTYRLLSVKDANNCEILAPHANLVGTATVTVRLAPVIGTSPIDRTICEYGATTFSATTSQGSDITWQWYVDKNTGTFEVLPEGGVFFGTNSTVLNIFGGSRSLNGYKFHAVATTCGISVTSGDATLTVNTSPVIETQPVEANVCQGDNTSFSVTAAGTGITYQWQVNTGGGFGDITDGGVYSGTSTPTLTLTNVPGSFNNFIYRVIVRGTCPSPAFSNFVPLRVATPPVVSLNPVSKSICAEAGTVFFTANGTGMIDEMRWQVNNSGTWSDLADDAIYNGTNTTQLSFINPPVSLNGKQYRLALIKACATVYTSPATLTVFTNPVVTFTPNPIANCGGTELTLFPAISSGSGTWVAHTWTGEVGPLSRYDVEAPVFKTLMNDSYDIIYKVKDSNGCFGTAPVTVNVESPDATFTQDVPAGCTPLTVSFTKNMTGITSWEWDFGDGSPKNTTDANPVHQYVNDEATAIQYRTVTLKVRSAGGCEISKTSTVTVYPKIRASFTANKNIVCHGEQITFTALPGANNYAWDYGDGVTANGSNVGSHTYNNTGADPVVHTVKVTTTSFYGCTATSEITVTILPKPVPAFSAAPTRQVYNSAGNTVVFTNETNAGTFTWSWTFGDGGTSADRNPSHTFTGTGEYNVTLEAGNGTCAAKISHKVYVDPLPPVASFDSIPYGCEPLEITFSNTSQNTNIPGTSYRWDFGDGGISVAKNPVYTYFDPGVYRIELTVTGPGGVSTTSRVVKVYASPVAAFDIAPTFVFVNDEKVRGFNLSQGADYYVWEWGDGDTSKVKDPFHKYMESGIYDVSLSAYKDNGNGNICYDKYVLSPGVTVEPAGDIRFSSVFRPNMDGPVEVSELPTGGDEIDQFFFPPIRDKVQNYKLQIFNRLGVLIFESRDINTPWNGYYKGQLCPQGVYVWYVEGKYANGQVYKKVGDITLLH